MDIQELESIESSEAVAFSFKPETKTIAVKGKREAAARALERIRGYRDEVADLLRARLAPEQEEVEIEVGFEVPSLAVQKENYRTWFLSKGVYFTPTEEELDRMFAACNEGDEIIPDFAHSFTVRRPNGLLQAVDRKGRVGQPSPYSPALAQK